MNRKGLWAGGLALILVVVGAAALLTTVGAGYAKDENASSRAKCSEATLKGTYLFAQNGVEIKGDEQRPFAIAGYDVFDGNGKVKGVDSSNFNGEITRNERFSGTYTRQGGLHRHRHLFGWHALRSVHRPRWQYINVRA